MVNVLKPIRVLFRLIANTIKPFFVIYKDGKRNETNVLLIILIINAIKPMFVFHIQMANTRKPMIVC